MNDIAKLDVINQADCKLKEFYQLADEIQNYRQNDELLDAIGCIGELSNLLEEYFEPNEQQVEVFASALDEDAVHIKDFVVNAMAANLRKTDIYSGFEETFKNASLDLTLKPHHLSDAGAARVVKFGFMVASHLAIECSEGTQKWSKYFTHYLEDTLQFNDDKIWEVVNATEIIASKLVKKILPNPLSTFYMNNLINELLYFPECFAEQTKISSDELNQHLTKLVEPLRCQVKLVIELQQQNESSKLELAWEELSKYLELIFRNRSK